MADFCLECWNKINESADSPKKYIFSKDLGLCEGCGEWKSVIIAERKDYYLYKLRYIIFPFKIIFKIIYILWRILILPFLIYKYIKSEDESPIIDDFDVL